MTEHDDRGPARAAADLRSEEARPMRLTPDLVRHALDAFPAETHGEPGFWTGAEADGEDRAGHAGRADAGTGAVRLAASPVAAPLLERSALSVDPTFYVYGVPRPETSVWQRLARRAVRDGQFLAPGVLGMAIGLVGVTVVAALFGGRGSAAEAETPSGLPVEIGRTDTSALDPGRASLGLRDPLRPLSEVPVGLTDSWAAAGDPATSGGAEDSGGAEGSGGAGGSGGAEDSGRARDLGRARDSGRAEPPAVSPRPDPPVETATAGRGAASRGPASPAGRTPPRPGDRRPPVRESAPDPPPAGTARTADVRALVTPPLSLSGSVMSPTGRDGDGAVDRDAAASPPTTPAAAAPGSSRGADTSEPPSATGARASIDELLEQYQVALSRMDLAMARRVWPGVDAAALGRAFSQLDEQSVEFDRCTVQVEAARARATCAGRATFVPRVGRQEALTQARTWTIGFSTVGGRWIIDSVRSR